MTDEKKKDDKEHKKLSNEKLEDVAGGFWQSLGQTVVGGRLRQRDPQGPAAGPEMPGGN